MPPVVDIDANLDLYATTERSAILIGGRCPTSTWKVGDILVDKFTTSVDTNVFGGGPLGPGSYQIWIGFFRGWFREWINMPISAAPAMLRDDVYKRVRLGSLSVER